MVLLVTTATTVGRTWTARATGAAVVTIAAIAATLWARGAAVIFLLVDPALDADDTVNGAGFS
ncbi:MAG TPA: hypothetical protein VF258_00240, partial [Luteolibacter sp.]